MRTTTTKRLAAAALCAAGALSAQAMDLQPHGISLDLGTGWRAPRMVGVGVMWDWDFHHLSRRAELTAHTELLLNRWTVDPVVGGHNFLWQYAVLPTLRMRLDRGASPVFIEVGVGLSWLDHEYRTPMERFGSRWDFYDVLGLGYTIGGPRGNNEVGLRWAHTSNGGFVEPNPGQNFFQLRYLRRF
jgi:lipid A 3-O-deacylase